MINLILPENSSIKNSSLYSSLQKIVTMTLSQILGTLSVKMIYLYLKIDTFGNFGQVFEYLEHF